MLILDAKTLGLRPGYTDIKVEMDETKDQHWYKVQGEKELYPSVSTITGMIDMNDRGEPGQKSEALMGWAKKMLKEALIERLSKVPVWELPERRVFHRWMQSMIEGVYKKLYMKQGADEGTQAHELVEELLSDGADIPLSRVAQNILHQDQPIIAQAVIEAFNFLARERIRPLAVELPVFSLAMRFAGTIDLVGIQREEQLVIVDWKRSKRLYRNHAYQVAGYGVVIEEVTEQTPKLVVVQLPQDPKGKYKARWVKDKRQARETFIDAYTLFQSAQEEVW